MSLAACERSPVSFFHGRIFFSSARALWITEFGSHVSLFQEIVIEAALKNSLFVQSVRHLKIFSSEYQSHVPREYFLRAPVVKFKKCLDIE
jgi:hypothetical protein